MESGLDQWMPEKFDSYWSWKDDLIESILTQHSYRGIRFCWANIIFNFTFVHCPIISPRQVCQRKSLRWRKYSATSLFGPRNAGWWITSCITEQGGSTALHNLLSWWGKKNLWRIGKK